MPESANFDVETLVLRVRELIESGRSMPMSASVLVNREELVGMLDDAIAQLPEELRHARWLLKEREEFLAQAKREADDILEAAQVQAARMVERTEVAREANRVAQSVVTAAEAESRQLKHEAEDYVDQKLAAFEVVLERTMQAVQKGRDRLQVVVEPLEDELVDDRAFFDQDDG
ncbi:MAG TPA: ATPase [Acidimicrobiia bacterium]|nr:ATPase [Acidimicrobiia bacterium]